MQLIWSAARSVRSRRFPFVLKLISQKRRERTDRAALQIDFKHMPGLTRSGIRVRSSSITCLSLSDGIGDDNFNPPIDLPSGRGVVARDWSCLAQTASAHNAIRLKAAV